jgi:DNA-binding transcriptional LysR family regulator
VTEHIDIRLKRAAVRLAEVLDYKRAAESLNLTTLDLKKQVGELEETLCIHIFEPGQRGPQLTDEGRFLTNAFREAVAVHDRNTSRDVDKKRS